MAQLIRTLGIPHNRFVERRNGHATRTSGGPLFRYMQRIVQEIYSWRDPIPAQALSSAVLGAPLDGVSARAQIRYPGVDGTGSGRAHERWEAHPLTTASLQQLEDDLALGRANSGGLVL